MLARKSPATYAYCSHKEVILSQHLSMTERFGHSVELSEERSELIKGTYHYLLYGVLAAAVGAYFGSQSETIISLMSSWMGWIGAILILNALPMIAIKARHNPVTGFLALLADGFFAGLVLGPVIFIAGAITTGTNIVLNAILLTGAVFATVTLAVWTSGKRYEAKRGLILGIFVAIIAAVMLNAFMPVGGIFGILISIAVGVMGVMILVYSTSDVLYDESIDHPIIGAVMLFAGLFNVFTAIINLLMAFGGDD